MSHASAQRHGKDSHSQEVPSETAPKQSLTALQCACRSAWARLIAKVYEVDL